MAEQLWSRLDKRRKTDVDHVFGGGRRDMGAFSLSAHPLDQLICLEVSKGGDWKGKKPILKPAKEKGSSRESNSGTKLGKRLGVGGGGHKGRGVFSKNEARKSGKQINETGVPLTDTERNGRR